MRFNKIFGIGLSKSGLSSLATALAKLGLKVVQWPTAWISRIVEWADWQIPLSYQEYDAFVDFGFWWFPKLDRLFPNSGFILTRRPLTKWLQSCERFFPSGSHTARNAYGTFTIASFDPDVFTWIYRWHNRAVEEYFAGRDNLLIFEEPFDWKPLCDFLDMPIPSVPYPHANAFVPRHVDHGRRNRMTYKEAILDRIPLGPVNGVEVGVIYGELSDALLTHRPELTLYMVDLWSEYPEESSYRRSGGYNAKHTQDTWNKIYARAVNIAQKHAPRAVIMRMDSVEAAQQFPDASLDFVFIDADHSYEGCLRDILAWYPKIRPGGWIGGHDYGLFGVADAVIAWSRKYGKGVILDAGTTWFSYVDD